MKFKALVLSMIVAVLFVFVSTASAIGVPVTPSDPNITNEVIIHCGENSNQQVDPILKFAQGASAHMHTPNGADVFSDSTTVPQMESASRTSCDVQSDHSLFWFPTILKPNGAPATIKSQSYFLTNQGYSIPTSVPLGLRFIAGNSACGSTSCNGNVIYQCAGSLATTHTIPTSCPNGNGYNEAIYAQNQCWDGASLGQGMGASTPPNVIGIDLIKTNDGTCPSGFSSIPGVGWTVHVAQDGVGGSLSSDAVIGVQSSCPGCTGHLDFVFGQGSLSAIISRCLDVAVAGTGTIQTCVEKPNGDGTNGLYALDSTGHYTVFVTN